MGLLSGKKGIVFGVANKRSIAWAIAQAWKEEGAQLAFTYQGERLKDNVSQLAETFGEDTLITECDVTQDDHIDRVFNEVGDKYSRSSNDAIDNFAKILNKNAPKLRVLVRWSKGEDIDAACGQLATNNE